MPDLKLKIMSAAPGRGVDGMDTSILTLPPECYATVEGEKVLNATMTSRVLRVVSEKQATDIGERLHHAEWTITTNPATVQSLGLMHDCDECRAGVARALELLEQEPTTELAVGALYWCD